jgi:hypothetical protein
MNEAIDTLKAYLPGQNVPARATLPLMLSATASSTLY